MLFLFMLFQYISSETACLSFRGIEVEHPDFEDRATWGADFTEGANNYVDENGHGTHVAGWSMIDLTL